MHRHNSKTSASEVSAGSVFLEQLCKVWPQEGFGGLRPGGSGSNSDTAIRDGAPLVIHMRRARISAAVVLRFLRYAQPVACFGVANPAALAGAPALL